MLLHGLTATRRYVVMGSRALQRSGHRVLAYDARGHGRSAPAADGDYGYERLAARPRGGARRGRRRARRARGRLDGRAHRAALRARRSPSASPALVLITPAFDPADAARAGGARALGRARARAARGRGGGLRRARTTSTRVPERWRATVETVLRQRLAAHEHPRRSPTRWKPCRARARSSDLGELAAHRRADASSSPAATRPTRATRWRSPSARPRCDPRRAAGRRGADGRARRSPGRAGSSRA